MLSGMLPAKAVRTSLHSLPLTQHAPSTLFRFCPWQQWGRSSVAMDEAYQGEGSSLHQRMRRGVSGFWFFKVSGLRVLGFGFAPHLA